MGADRLLDLLLDPTTVAWELSADGSWQRNDGEVDAQERLVAEAAAGASEPQR